MNEITIPLEKYEELLDLKARVAVIAEIIKSEEFIPKETVLRIIGVNKTADLENHICEKSKDISFDGMLGK